MRVVTAAALILLAACDDVGDGTARLYEGPPPFMYLGPGSKHPGKAEVFYEFPQCVGRAYLAESDEAFDYWSVRVGEACVEEAGTGYGFQVGP